MREGDRLKQIGELVADREIMIHELKNMNLRLSEIVMIDRKRLELLEKPWWKRIFAVS